MMALTSFALNALTYRCSSASIAALSLAAVGVAAFVEEVRGFPASSAHTTIKARETKSFCIKTPLRRIPGILGDTLLFVGGLRQAVKIIREDNREPPWQG